MATHPVAGSTHKRSRHLKGALDADRERRLRDLTGWTWGRKADLWEEGFRQLLRYYERHGHARMVSYTIDGHKLGVGVNTQLFSEPGPSPRRWRRRRNYGRNYRETRTGSLSEGIGWPYPVVPNCAA
jgi:hypothetical protein